MPELPEVETIARGLARQVVGDTIESVWIGDKPQPLKSTAAEIVQVLEGATITAVRRVGKHLVVDLTAGKQPQRRKRKNRFAKAPASATRQWIIHLGMTGRVLVSSPAAEMQKHTHLVARLASGREVRFVDPRRFGRLAVLLQDPFAAAGMEPLSVGIEGFIALFRRRKTPIKSALLNQKLLSGVGNIYADESLYRAGIRPRRRAASLTRADLTALHRELKRVLLRAIKAKGSSVSDYVDESGQQGGFQLQHRVYGREGEPCYRCKTPVKRIVIAGRSSHYCPRCQK